MFGSALNSAQNPWKKNRFLCKRITFFLFVLCFSFNILSFVSLKRKLFLSSLSMLRELKGNMAEIFYFFSSWKTSEMHVA